MNRQSDNKTKRTVRAHFAGILLTLAAFGMNQYAAAQNTPANALIYFPDTSISVSETNSHAVVRVRAEGGSGELRVDFNTDNLSAIAGADYVSTNGTLVWNSAFRGDTNIIVPIIQDTNTEPIEAFQVLLSNPVGASLGAATNVVQIIDSGLATVRLEMTNYTVTESWGGVFVSVRRSAATPGQVDLFPSSITAHAHSDYYFHILRVQWHAGDNSLVKSAYIGITNDWVAEATEQFRVSLVNPSGFSIAQPGSAIVTIIDDDISLQDQVSFIHTNLFVSESSPAIVIPIERTGTGQVSADVRIIPGTAFSGQDYSFTNNPRTITWATNASSSNSFEVTILDDHLVESNEFFHVEIENLVGAVVGSNRSVTVHIQDNDFQTNAPTASYGWWTNEYATAEADGVVILHACRDRADGFVRGSIQVMTNASTATLGADFLLLSNEVVFQARTLFSSPIAVQLIQDELHEETELAFLGLQFETNVNFKSNSVMTLHINDSFATNDVIEFRDRFRTIRESDGGVFFEVVRRALTNVGPAEVAVSASLVSAGFNDFQLGTTNLSWAAGDTSPRFVFVSITNDSVAETNEFFDLHLLQSTNPVTIGSNHTLRVMIEDDDATTNAIIDFQGLTGHSASESNTFAEILVHASGGHGPIGVEFFTTNITAIGGLDFVHTNGFLHWPAGDRNPRTVRVPLLGDYALETTEQFQLVLTNATEGAALGQEVYTIGLLNHVLPTNHVSMYATILDVSEDAGGIMVPVIRHGTGTGYVDVVNVAETAMAGADFPLLTNRLVWGVGDTGVVNLGVVKHAWFPIVDDNLQEPSESFTVHLVNPVGLSLAQHIASRVIIEDDDTATNGAIIVSGGTNAFEQSINHFVHVRISGHGGPARVDFQTADGTALAGQDYVATNGTLIWTTNDSSPKTVALQILTDRVQENLEFFHLVFTNAVGAVVSNSTHRITIQDSSQVAGAFRQLPPGYFPGIPLTVTVDINPPTNTASHAIEELPPPGWIATNISHGGVYDPVTGKVKMGPFFDSTNRVLTYDLIAPAGEFGTWIISGVLSVDGSQITVGGDQTLQAVSYHSADTNQNWHVQLPEVTAYGAAWRRGHQWPIGPNPIPIDHVTSAAWIWRNGEAYQINTNRTNSDPAWIPNVLAIRTPASADTSSGVVFAQSYGAFQRGRELTIRLKVTPPTAVGGWAVEEELPANVNVLNASHGGEVDAINDMLKWGPFFDSQPRELVYTLAWANTATSAALSGRASFDGRSINIRGQRALQRGSWILSNRDQLQNLGTEGFKIRWLEEDGQVSEVEYTTNFINWLPLPTTGVQSISGGKELADPGSAGQVRRFYRIRESGQ
ncbi:MAG: hypothetical protein CMO80_08605 [Verrucomicrobiales bacterium]|nr:hypothetical protein [Verrucomicrobiales bacterium]|tara:strand:+ start:2490 stop:6518 length:4029 start_codon:yes stop_codon:yes gene_type:complete